MLPSQMMKVILDNCILIVIAQEDTYGYDISQKLKSYGFSNISEGTIYPLLLRLEKNGCINSEFRKSAYGPIENTTLLQKPVIWKYRIL